MLSRRSSKRTFRARLLVSGGSFAMIFAAILAGGCASSSSGPSRVAGPIQSHPAHSYPGDRHVPARLPVVPAARVEIEDDGLPSQLAPRNRKPIADDPTQPWSPNYGTARGTERTAERLDMAPLPPPLPPARTTYGASRTASIDADDIIRRAIAEHEMRQR
jgi:hypothetical protein